MVYDTMATFVLAPVLKVVYTAAMMGLTRIPN